jgi:hypothetical protein
MEKITYVRGQDWEGLYIDGELVEEGHSICVEEVVEALGFTCERIMADQEWLEDRGDLPYCLGEVKPS